jgi:hypothetical protein
MHIERIELGKLDPAEQQAIMNIVRKYCEDRGVAYPDEWSFTYLHDVRIEFGVSVDLS